MKVDFINKRIFYIIAAALLLVIPVTATLHSSQPSKELDCSLCHTCEQPSSENTCLKSCPSFSGNFVHARHDLADAPDTIMIDFIADQYQPVRFDHKAHANMAQMNLECATCHIDKNFSKPDCSGCHDEGFSIKDGLPGKIVN